MQIYIVLLLHVCSCNVYAATTLVPGKEEEKPDQPRRKSVSKKKKAGK